MLQPKKYRFPIVHKGNEDKKPEETTNLCHRPRR